MRKRARKRVGGKWTAGNNAAALNGGRGLSEGFKGHMRQLKWENVARVTGSHTAAFSIGLPVSICLGRFSIAHLFIVEFSSFSIFSWKVLRKEGHHGILLPWWVV